MSVVMKNPSFKGVKAFLVFDFRLWGERIPRNSKRSKKADSDREGGKNPGYSVNEC
jgi:hypothetical protein